MQKTNRKKGVAKYAMLRELLELEKTKKLSHLLPFYRFSTQPIELVHKSFKKSNLHNYNYYNYNNNIIQLFPE